MSTSDYSDCSSSDEEISVLAPSSKRDKFLSTYHRQQSWPIPDSILYYITKNPSSALAYANLIMSCKHFFIQNPLLIISRASFENNNDYWSARFNDSFVKFKNLTSKFWITTEFRIRIDTQNERNFLSTIIPKIYQSEIKSLILWNQDISFNELMFLASKCEYLSFSKVTVTDYGGSVVPLEKFVAALFNIKNFHFDAGDNASKIITSKTVPELIQIPTFKTLDQFSLTYITEALDIDQFYGYIKKNKKTKFFLHFCDPVSEEYETRLQAIVNEIVAIGNRDFKPPYILFPRIERSSRNALWELYLRG